MEFEDFCLTVDLSSLYKGSLTCSHYKGPETGATNRVADVEDRLESDYLSNVAGFLEELRPYHEHGKLLRKLMVNPQSLNYVHYQQPNQSRRLLEKLL